MKATICLPALLTCMLLGATGSPPTASAEEHSDLVGAAHAAAQRNDAAAILQKTRDLYRTLEWFSADGEATVRMKFMGAETTTSLAVSIKLGRPDRYLVSWGRRKTQMNGAPAPGESGDEIEGAAWNAGAGAYNYARQFAAYARAPSDDSARAMATGISQGAANTIPSLFFGGPGQIAEIETARLEGTEAIDGETCWVISGPSRVSEKETLWISTHRLVVRQYRHSAKPPAGAPAVLDLSDQKIDEGLAAAGLEPTPENRAQLKSIMEVAKVAMKHRDALDGTFTETYRSIRLHGPAAPADFEFHVPEGTPLRASLLGGPAPPPDPQPLRGAGTGEDAGKLLERVLARYRALRSFSADGEIVSRQGVFGTQLTQTQGFSLRLARPSLYRISWSGTACAPGGDATGTADACTPDGAAWNAGDGAFQYGRMLKEYAKAGDDRSALAVAAGVSGGITRGVPSLFLHGAGWLTGLTDPTLEGTQTVQGEDCYVVSASERDWATHTLWISRARSLILQHRQVNRHPVGEAGALEGMEKRATPEARPGVEMMIDLQKAMAEHRGAVRADTTEIYRNIHVDEAVEPSDFAFKVPEGTTLKKSLVEGAFEFPPMTPPSATPPR